MKRALIYARCSSQGQADKDLSIPAQLDAARDFARQQGWEVVGEYVDEAESARTSNRPEFLRMVGGIRTGELAVEHIIVWKFSRFARNRRDSVLYKEILAGKGVRIVSLSEPVDDSPAGSMLEGMLEVLDEYYSANLAEDTVRGMKKNASLGFSNGGRTPTGYQVKRTGDLDSPKGIYEPNPEYAPIVRRIARDYLGGDGGKAIASKLNHEGLRTRRGKLWTTQAILNILRNETYTGVRLWGRNFKGRRAGEEPVRVEGAHDALISAEDFGRIQARLASRAPQRAHPRRLGSGYLLSGLLVCGVCGRRYVGHSAKSGKHFYYSCDTKLRAGASACTAKNLNKERAEDAVTEQLRDVVLAPLHFADLVRMVNEELESKTEAASAELATVEVQLAEAQGKLTRLFDAVEAGVLDIADLAPRIRERRGQVSELQAARGRLLSRPDGVPRLQADPATVAAQVEGLRSLLAKGTVGQRRAFLRAWVKKIEVHGRELRIVYSFPWLPEGEPVAANEEPGGVVLLDEERAARGARTPKAEPSECRVLPLVVNGSAWRSSDEPPRRPTAR